MRKRKVQWLVAACVFCLAQPVWAATESTTVYQDQLDSVDQSYLGEISKASTPEKEGGKIFYPGEIEITTREDHMKNGIPVLEEVWDKIQSL